jgi:hypothetical protein
MKETFLAPINTIKIRANYAWDAHRSLKAGLHVKWPVLCDIWGYRGGNCEGYCSPFLSDYSRKAWIFLQSSLKTPLQTSWKSVRRRSSYFMRIDAFHFALFVNARKRKWNRFVRYVQRLLRGAALLGSHRTSTRTLRRGNADEEVPFM